MAQAYSTWVLEDAWGGGDGWGSRETGCKAQVSGLSYALAAVCEPACVHACVPPPTTTCEVGSMHAKRRNSG